MKRILLGICILTGVLNVRAQDVENGYAKFYYPNGQVSSEGTMKDGKPDGFWKTYYVSGIIKSEGLRRNYELDSTWTFYNQSGEVVQRINYKYGKKNGYSFSYGYANSLTPVVQSKELYVNDKKEGRSYYYFDNGALKEEVMYTNGKREGPAREYDKEGDVITLLEYHNNYLINRERINREDSKGLKQGDWKVFYNDGRIYKEMNYIDNQLDGLYKEYGPKGNLVLVLRYDKGKIVEDNKDDILQEELNVKRKFDDKGNLIFAGSYRDSVPVGIHRYYDAEGHVINAKIFDQQGDVVSEGIVDETGSREGAWKNFYLTGEVRAIGRYVKNQRNGEWTFFYKDGKKEQEGSYLRGLPDGIWMWYYSDGDTLRRESYFNGREDGEMVEYDSTGNVISKGNYINGEKEGDWIHFVNDHKEVGNYQTGLRTGDWKYYYGDGTLEFEGEFNQGLADGKQKFYFPDGNIKEERYYERGLRERNWKKYDEAGNLIMTITYKSNVEYRINGQKINLPEGSVKMIK
ncbi:MAG TPA: hypothetical protein VE870_12035 [Bacteroidales bacterium]|nr:hypothetical protein [Bacteroidales bacterium]